MAPQSPTAYVKPMLTALSLFHAAGASGPINLCRGVIHRVRVKVVGDDPGHGPQLASAATVLQGTPTPAGDVVSHPSFFSLYSLMHKLIQ